MVGTVPPRRVDPVLQAFVNIADTGSGVAGTLLVGGTLVHGTLVSERRWLELLDEAYVRVGMEAPGFAEGAPTPDGLEELRGRQERILDARDRARDEGDRDRFDDLTRRLQWSAQDHVHLTEVQVVAAGVPPLRLTRGC